jgi:hypothetical protein
MRCVVCRRRKRGDYIRRRGGSVAHRFIKMTLIAAIYLAVAVVFVLSLCSAAKS